MGVTPRRVGPGRVERPVLARQSACASDQSVEHDVACRRNRVDHQAFQSFDHLRGGVVGGACLSGRRGVGHGLVLALRSIADERRSFRVARRMHHAADNAHRCFRHWLSPPSCPRRDGPHLSRSPKFENAPRFLAKVPQMPPLLRPKCKPDALPLRSPFFRADPARCRRASVAWDRPTRRRSP